jgi:hypothetical protein
VPPSTARKGDSPHIQVLITHPRLPLRSSLPAGPAGLEGRNCITPPAFARFRWLRCSADGFISFTGDVGREEHRSSFCHDISDAVGETVNARAFGAVRAAENPARHFHSVAYDPATTVLTGRCQRVNRAFETIENMRDVVTPHFEGLVVVISTDFTFRHGSSRVKN